MDPKLTKAEIDARATALARRVMNTPPKPKDALVKIPGVNWPDWGETPEEFIVWVERNFSRV